LTTERQKQQWLSRCLGSAERHLDKPVQLAGGFVVASNGAAMHAARNPYTDRDDEHPQYDGLMREVHKAQERLDADDGGLEWRPVAAFRAAVTAQLAQGKAESERELAEAKEKLAAVRADKARPARKYQLAAAKSAVTNAKLMLHCIDMRNVLGLDQPAPVLVDVRLLLAAIPAGQKDVRISCPADVYAGPIVLGFSGGLIAAIMGVRP
jgi:hypothetical protein